MGQLRDRMVQDLRLAGYSQSTRRIYLLYATKFAQHFRRSPEILGEREIRRYFLHLLDERQLSHDAYRQAHSALKFLYTVTLKRPWDIPCLPRRRSPHPLPDVLSGSEVRRLLESIGNFDRFIQGKSSPESVRQVHLHNDWKVVSQSSSHFL